MNGPFGQLGPAATLGQHCPSLTQSCCIDVDTNLLRICSHPTSIHIPLHCRSSSTYQILPTFAAISRAVKPILFVASKSIFGNKNDKSLFILPK